MSPRQSPFSKTHRYLEILSLLFLSFPLLSQPLVAPTGGFFWFRAAAALTIATALLFRGLRHVSWFVTAAAGLVTMVLSPEEVTGSVLCLLAAFLLFDSGFFGPFQQVAALVFALLFVAGQASAWALHPESFAPTFLRTAATDLLVLVLVRLFRTDLAAPGADRPELHLSRFALTERETQILRLLWGGETIKEIAFAIRLSEGRVRNHLSHIYRKLDVPGAKELYAMGHTHHILLEEDAAPTTATTVAVEGANLTKSRRISREPPFTR